MRPLTKKKSNFFKIWLIHFKHNKHKRHPVFQKIFFPLGPIMVFTGSFSDFGNTSLPEVSFWFAAFILPCRGRTHVTWSHFIVCTHDITHQRIESPVTPVTFVIVFQFQPKLSLRAKSRMTKINSYRSVGDAFAWDRDCLRLMGRGLLANGFPNCTVAMAKLNGFPVPDVLSGLGRASSRLQELCCVSDALWT